MRSNIENMLLELKDTSEFTSRAMTEMIPPEETPFCPCLIAFSTRGWMS